MEDLKNKTLDLVDHVEDIADTFYKLTMVTATQKVSNATSSIILLIAISVFGMFVILFAGIAFSLWMGSLLDNRALGFLIGSGLFVLVTVIIISLRKKILFPYIRNLILRESYE